MLQDNQNKCPNCGKFMMYEDDGFYDREWPYHETAQVVQYCDESCCDAKRAKVARIARAAEDHEFDADCRSLVAS